MEIAGDTNNLSVVNSSDKTVIADNFAEYFPPEQDPSNNQNEPVM
jgi:hypothetical protein